ncbi:CheW-like domain-containing protein [Thiohalospira halophila DSM 15071]|uniref:CheW-like domain-containing protein n=1 Tax=Thiohalospira halophila DSM 15071 TaxID=1123397 RepID=A0A1I1SFS2_9GAMM|nr:chemotaxis protein CheW [Thiohalospira halophila]SFD45319.1 CheW-like domain-containing protein [Thiohalospira halophila DSM 15071]
MATTDPTVHCLILPFQGGQLLVPGAVVAEILPFATLQPASAGPPWYLGTFQWQGRPRDLVGLEPLMGQGVPVLERRLRVAVLHTLDQRAEPGAFGVVMQRIPRQLAVGPETPLTDEAGDGAAVARWLYGQEECYALPDIDWIRDGLTDLHAGG